MSRAITKYFNPNWDKINKGIEDDESLREIRRQLTKIKRKINHSAKIIRKKIKKEQASLLKKQKEQEKILFKRKIRNLPVGTTVYYVGVIKELNHQKGIIEKQLWDKHDVRFENGKLYRCVFESLSLIEPAKEEEILEIKAREKLGIKLRPPIIKTTNEQ